MMGMTIRGRRITALHVEGEDTFQLHVEGHTIDIGGATARLRVLVRVMFSGDGEVLGTPRTGRR